MGYSSYSPEFRSEAVRLVTEHRVLLLMLLKN
jgi:transposase-like protein